MVVLPQVRPLRVATGGGLGAHEVVGRDEIIASWWQAVESESLRLNEPRRLGKSVALRRMSEQPPPGWTAVYTSFQDVTTVSDLVGAVVRSLHNHRGRSTRLRERVRQFLPANLSLEFVGIDIGLNPAFTAQPLHALELLLDDVADHLDPGERLLLAWDEVPDMIRGITETEGAAAARSVLLAVRKFADGPGGRRIRWIMTGSVGFHHVLHHLPGTDSLVNVFGTARLGPLTAEWAGWLATCLYLGEGIHAGPDVCAEVARITDGIPFLIHHVVKHARDLRLTVVERADVGPHFDAFAADLDGSQQMTAMLTRLSDYYGDATEAAEWLLDRIAEQPRARTELAALSGPLPAADSAVRELLRTLVLDHYLIQDVGGAYRYRWRYSALARIWTIRRR